MNTAIKIQRLLPAQAHLAPSLQTMFGKAFEDVEGWRKRRPDAAYLAKLLDKPEVIVLAAVLGDEVIGGLVAYELPMLEQPRSEMYVYDLAVDAVHRRQGIATTLIEALQPIAHACGAWVIFIQADDGDESAMTLYNKLGTMIKVMHFDIAVRNRRIK